MEQHHKNMQSSKSDNPGDMLEQETHGKKYENDYIRQKQNLSELHQQQEMEK